MPFWDKKWTKKIKRERKERGARLIDWMVVCRNKESGL
jgi:hypothetical protein